MKTRVLTLLLVVSLLFIAAPKPAQAYVSAGVSVGVFYNELSPYGRWVDCSYGYAWVPAVAVGWQPYVDGQWVWTDYGWTWVSYDPWPDDPFHYGSWYWDAGFGWAWVPGFVWAPAWVTWCYGDDFIGWAPVPPTFAFAAHGYSGGPVVTASAGYVFVPGSRFVGTRVSSVRMPASSNPQLIRRGRSVTSFGVNGGVVTNAALSVSRVQAMTGRSVPLRSISVARTDPRPIPQSTTGRVAVVAQPAVLRAGIGHSHIVPAPRTVSAAPERNRSRILVTNRGGGAVRTAVTPGTRWAHGSTGAAPRVTGGPTRYVAPAPHQVWRVQKPRTQPQPPPAARAVARPFAPRFAAPPPPRRRPTPRRPGTM